MKEENKSNLTFLVILLVITMIFLIVISFHELKRGNYLKENGIETEAKLIGQERKRNTSGTRHNPLAPRHIYEGTYIFKGNNGEKYKVYYKNTNKDKITDAKILYYNPDKFGEYVWEDNNPFSWVEEMILFLIGVAFFSIISIATDKKK